VGLGGSDLARCTMLVLTGAPEGASRLIISWLTTSPRHSRLRST